MDQRPIGFRKGLKSIVTKEGQILPQDRWAFRALSFEEKGLNVENLPMTQSFFVLVQDKCTTWSFRLSLSGTKEGDNKRTLFWIGYAFREDLDLA